MREVSPPGSRYKGSHKVLATNKGKKGWDQLCKTRSGPMERCYRELADNPFPPGQLARHHQLKGKLKGSWEYEVTGGDRVRYRKGGPKGAPVVIHAGSAPADTH